MEFVASQSTFGESAPGPEKTQARNNGCTKKNWEGRV